MSNPVDTQRTYALVGTGGCGKTSLAEMLLFNSGALTRMGAIEDGTTCLDYEPEEVRRRGSIQPAVATCLWNKNRHFMLDIPGDGNFTGDMECLLKGVDGVVFVLDAVDGVRPLTKKFWNLTRAENLPAIFVINKMDRDRADFQMAFDGLSTLGVKAVALQVPIREGEAFTGYVDVLTGKAYTFGADGAVSECDVPADVADDVSLLHDLTVENIAESDEELMEKYLEEGSLSLEDLQIGLRKGTVAGELCPVLVCSSLENKGGVAVLEAIQALLPAASERPAFVDALGQERKPDPDAPVAGFVFKTLADPFSGQLSLVRILSGTINGDATLKNMRSGENERLGSLLFLLAPALASLFSPDPAVISLGADMLRIVALAQPLFGVSIVLSGALRGAEDSKYPFLVGLWCMWGIRVVLAPVFAYVLNMGLSSVWIAMAIDLCARGILCWRRFSGKRWIKNVDGAGPEEASAQL